MSTPSVQAYITDTVYNGKVDKTVKHIAIIGYGVVGGGITAFLEQNGTEVEKTVGEPVSVNISSICVPSPILPIATGWFIPSIRFLPIRT